jgi:dipeptidyl aminopeptidase/acylaminoacyl peptidase
MVYIQSEPSVTDIWRLAHPASSARREAPQKLLLASMNPAYAPDGRTIAFESRRGGPNGIWLGEADGSRPVQLTRFKSDSGTPRWSPDGRRLAFDSLEAGNWDIYVVGTDGGAPRRLTADPSEDAIGTWSRDGRSIYFNSDRSGRTELWKVAAEGGTAVQVTRGGGYYALESEDGRSLYYSKEQVSGVWRAPLAGGQESQVVSGPVPWQSWALGHHGLYYSTTEDRVPVRRVRLTIEYLDFASGRTTPLLIREGGAFWGGLAVSPDEKWILFGEAQPWQADLALIENFR